MIASAVIVSSAQSSVKRARERRAQKVRHLKRSLSTNNLHHQHALHEHCATSQQPQMQTDGQSIISNERQWSIHNCAGGLVNRHNRTRGASRYEKLPWFVRLREVGCAWLRCHQIVNLPRAIFKHEHDLGVQGILEVQRGNCGGNWDDNGSAVGLHRIGCQISRATRPLLGVPVVRLVDGDELALRDG